MNETEAKQAADFRQQAALNAATPKPRAGEHVAAPQFGVDWKDQSVTLFTRDGFILARSNDSAKGKIFESIVAMEAERDLLREREKALAEALNDLIGKIEVMNGCNPYDFDSGAENEWPEFQLARALLAKHGR
jgi:hypothetical protein